MFTANIGQLYPVPSVYPVHVPPVRGPFARFKEVPLSKLYVSREAPVLILSQVLSRLY